MQPLCVGEGVRQQRQIVLRVGDTDGFDITRPERHQCTRRAAHRPAHQRDARMGQAGFQSRSVKTQPDILESLAFQFAGDFQRVARVALRLFYRRLARDLGVGRRFVNLGDELALHERDGNVQVGADIAALIRQLCSEPTVPVLDGIGGTAFALVGA